MQQNASQFDIVILGLSITSSWGNGHASTYRSLIKALSRRGHKILFLERHQPWYAENRDLRAMPHCEIAIYSSLSELRKTYARRISNADLVIVGSYVPEGIEVGSFVCEKSSGITAFYDIDTPITLTDVLEERCPYLNRELASSYQLYLSFTGGRILSIIEEELESPAARPLYCSVDPDEYHPILKATKKYELGYLGTYSSDRQVSLERMLIESARILKRRSFAVIGAQYPKHIRWPKNIIHREHLDPSKHARFFNSQKFTLNLTRQRMIEYGFSPSVRLFEASACGTPIISDDWPGIESFFKPNEEILIAESTQDVVEILRSVSEGRRLEISRAALKRTLGEHTSAHRALELENYVFEIYDQQNQQHQYSRAEKLL